MDIRAIISMMMQHRFQTDHWTKSSKNEAVRSHAVHNTFEDLRASILQRDCFNRFAGDCCVHRRLDAKEPWMENHGDDALIFGKRKDGIEATNMMTAESICNVGPIIDSADDLANRASSSPSTAQSLMHFSQNQKALNQSSWIGELSRLLETNFGVMNRTWRLTRRHTNSAEPQEASCMKLVSGLTAHTLLSRSQSVACAAHFGFN